MTDTRRFALALGIVAVLAPASSVAAKADPEEVQAIAISPITIVGELPKQSGQRLQQRLRDGVGEAGFTVATTGPTLRTTVTVVQRDYTIVAELVDDGHVLVRAEEECDLCGVEEAGDRIAGIAASIRRQLDADSRARPVLSVTTRPAGATVIVDGEAVGSSPLELALDPGMHDVRVAKDGFVPRRREVELVRGVEASIDVDLFPVAPVEVEAPKRRTAPGWVGWTVLGAGAVSTIAGVALLAVHGKPIRSKCTGANVDMDGTCRFVHDSVVPGAIVGAVGLGLLATGIGLVVTHKKHRKPSNLALTRNGLRVRF